MRQKVLILYVIVSLLNFLHPEFLSARDAPITTAGSSIVCEGAAVVIPITVTGFITVKAITLRLDYDPTQLVYVSYSGLNSSLSGASVNSVNISSNLSKILIVWSDVNSLTLPDGAKLLDLNFTLTTGSPAVSFNNTANSGGECEYADETGAAMNDIPTSTFYFNATVTNHSVAAAGTITGSTTLCAGTSNVAYSVPAIANATDYIWNLPTGGSIISGGNTNSIVVNYSNSAISGNVTVAGSNSCGTGTPFSLAVTINPLPVPVITGLGTVCAGSTGIPYTTTSGMTNYTWVVSSGGNVAGGTGTATITVNWNTAGTQSVTLNYTNSNGCVAATPTVKTVIVNPLPVPTITGNTSICLGPANYTYTTEPAMSSYSWTVSAGGSIISGAGSNAILVNWSTAGSKSVTVSYSIPSTGCSAAIPTSKAVTVNELPVPTLTGPLSACIGSSGNVYVTEAGMTGYLWALTFGGTVTGGGGSSNNTITVTWNTAGPQGVSINYMNQAGCTAQNPTSTSITVHSLPVPTINGLATVCQGTTGVSYSTEPGMTNYLWTISPGGSITFGSGTDNILVSWNTAGAQSLSINYTDGNGCTASVPVSKNISVDLVPGPAGIITGSDTVCAGTNGVIYSVPPIANAVTYEWTVPAGATITSGGLTNQIVVSFSASPGSGVMTVKGTSGCGSGAVSPDFNVTMIASQAVPVVTAVGPLLTSTTSTGNQWYYEGTGLIPGATGQTYTATITGWYWTVVLGVGCPTLESNHVFVLFTGRDDLQNNNFSVYPVPNDGKFKVMMTTFSQESFTIQVYNQLGAKIFERDDIPVNGTIEQPIDIRPVANGIYSVVFLNSEHTVVRKVLVK